MGQLYMVGAVVMCFIKYEDIIDSKARPVVILEVYNDSYLICPITGTDRSAQFRGRWITSNMPEYSAMGLSKDSFVNFEKQATVKSFMFKGPIGECPFVDEIEIL